MMLNEYRTPRCFWAEAINTACYISNQIFLCSLLNLTRFELRFRRQSSISHLRSFGCKCFILKCGNLDKFESRSLDGIFLGYTPHGRSYRVLHLETNIIVESCDVTFESAGDKEVEESIFVDEELQDFEGDEDEHIAPVSTSSPGHIPASTLEAEATQAATSFSIGVHASGIEGEINSENGATSHIQKAHLPQHCPHDVFESAGDKEVEESIFVDEELQDFEGDEDEHIAPASTSSPGHIPASTLEAEATQAATSFSVGVHASGIEGEINSENGAPSHIQKAHLPQQIIGNLNESVTQSSRLAHLSCFTNTLFVALFEPRDVGRALSDSSWVNAVHEELENF
jgi:hypothetical protein